MKKNKFFNKNYLTALGISTYPVTLLFTSNFVNTNLLMYVIPLILVYFFTTCLYFIFFIINKCFSIANYHLSTGIISIFFFIYGIYYALLMKYDNLLSFFVGHRVFLPITIMIIIGLVYFINSIERKSFKYKFILVFLITINLAPLFSLFGHFLSLDLKKSNDLTKVATDSTINHPNIYYIILDGYGSDYSIKKYLHHDNSNFTNQLEKIGFKIQTKATSNYCRTIFSLTSTLNLNYVQNFMNTTVTQHNLNKRLANNKVLEILQSYGYTYYIFDSGFGLKNKYASNEVLIKTNEIGLLRNLFSTSDKDVLNSFINNSIFVIFNNSIFAKFAINNYASKVLDVFSKLPQIAEAPIKKFVFTHIISPHPPFLFDKYGKVGVYGKYDPTLHGNFNWNPKLYIEQLKFVNTRILSALKDVIKNDKNEKIIIIQGDHGTKTVTETNILDENQNWVQEEYGILNAIYISKNDKSKKYIYDHWDEPSVNTFRIIFNEYFGYNFQLLENYKYYAKFKEPYFFNRVASSKFDKSSIKHE
jgi:hypothetical protein